MMKLLVVVGLILSTSYLQAAQDKYSSMLPAVWRSSQACGPVAFAVLSTGTVIVHAVSIDSATVNAGGNSFLAIFNSSTTPNPTNADRFLTTGTLTATNVFSTQSGFLSSPPFEYNAVFSTGAVVNKLGNSCTTVWWGYPVDKVRADIPWRP